MNPPSAWAVAKRDAPDIAAHAGRTAPYRTQRQVCSFLPFFWSIWSFSKNKEAAKSLLVHLSATGFG